MDARPFANAARLREFDIPLDETREYVRGVFSDFLGSAYSERKFLAHFSPCEEAFVDIWANYGSDLGCHLRDLLPVFRWMAGYPNFDEIAREFGISRSTALENIRFGVDLLSSTLEEIDVENGYYNKLVDNDLNPLDRVVHLVDTTPWGLHKFKPRSASWKSFFSKKHGYPAWKFLSSVPVLRGGDYQGLLYWSRFGLPGSFHDGPIYEISKLRQSLEEERLWHRSGRLLPSLGFADKGFEGESLLLSPYKGMPANLRDHQIEWNRILNSHRVGIENVYGRMKTLFNIAVIPYRGHHTDVHDIAWICANLTNADIIHRPLRRYTT